MADDHRPFFTRLDVLGHQQDASGDHVGVDVDHGFPATVCGGVQDLAGADIGGHVGPGQATDQFVVDHVTVRFDRAGPGLEIRAIDLVPDLVADLGAASQQCLREGDKFSDLLTLASIRVGQRAVHGGLGAVGHQLAGRSQPAQECRECLGSSGLAVSFARGDQGGAVGGFQPGVNRGRTVKLGSYLAQGAVFDRPGCRPTTASLARGRRTRHFRSPAGFDYQWPGGDQSGQFRIAKLGQLAPDVPVNWFTPDFVSLVKVPTDHRGGDACVDRCRVQCQQASLANSHDSHRQCRRLVVEQRIDGRLDLLDLIADHVSAHFKCHPIDELAVRLVGVANPGIAGESGVPADQRWHDHPATVFGQPASQLGLGRDTIGQSGELFGRPVCIGQGDHVGDGFSCWHQHQSPGRDSIQHVPAGPVSRPGLGATQSRRSFECRDQLDSRRGGSIIDGPDYRPEPCPVGLDTLGVGLVTRKISFPEGRPGRGGIGQGP